MSIQCGICRSHFDPSNLAEVAAHQHSGLPLDDFMGKRSERVRPTRQSWYKTAEHWERYAFQLESYLDFLEAKP